MGDEKLRCADEVAAPRRADLRRPRRARRQAERVDRGARADDRRRGARVRDALPPDRRPPPRGDRDARTEAHARLERRRQEEQAVICWPWYSVGRRIQVANAEASIRPKGGPVPVDSLP